MQSVRDAAAACILVLLRRARRFLWPIISCGITVLAKGCPPVDRSNEHEHAEQWIFVTDAFPNGFCTRFEGTRVRERENQIFRRPRGVNGAKKAINERQSSFSPTGIVCNPQHSEAYNIVDKI